MKTETETKTRVSRKIVVEPLKKKSNLNYPWPVRFYQTSVGKKYAMAISGIVLLGFIFGHMAGNLKMYLGAETCAYALTIQNRKARNPENKYRGPREYSAANFASRTMRWGGIIIFLFLFWHLADLT